MKLAHISDLHLRHHLPGVPSAPVRRGRDALEHLKEVLSLFEAQQVDGLVITGDIIDAPRWMWKDGFYYDTSDISYWEQMVYLEYMMLDGLFKEQKYPVWTVPGNHDHPNMYRKIFGRQLEPSLIKDFTLYQFSDWNHRGSMPRRLDKERKLLDSALSQGPDKQIHLQHYVIAPEIEHHYPYNYMEWEFLKKYVVDSGKVSLCLSGHFHRGAQAKIGTTHFFTVPSFSEFPHPYAIYHIEENGTNGSEVGVEVESGQLLTGTREAQPLRSAIFLDRDGCLTVEPSFYGGPGELELLPGVVNTLKSLKEQGYVLVVITNQTCVGQGYVTEDMIPWVHDEFCRELQEQGTYIDGFYFAKGLESEKAEKAVHPKYVGDETLKPSPNLLYKASQDLGIDLTSSYMIGDRLTDLQCGIEAGCQSVLVRTGDGKKTEAHLPHKLKETVEVVDSLGYWKVL